MAATHAVDVRNFLYAKQRYGYDDAFAGVCQEVVDELAKGTASPLFDAVLIDEAQDLPHAFFELVFLATKPPKRIVFAYDELQNLSNYTMAPPSELFGKDSTGEPRVRSLHNEEGAARRDIVLPVCYRNTPWALTVAHALGFGIYREDQLVQFFDDPDLWQEIGYEIVSGEMRPGQHVTMRRRREASPDFFDRLVRAEDAVTCHVFEDGEQQADWVAASIKQNVTADELELRDILIVLSDPVTARRLAAPVIQALQNQELASHLAGVTTSVDELFDEDSIAISGIYRAKGNEAAMVYVLTSEYGVPSFELIKRRNVLFTAITRSRAWVRLCGSGPGMRKIKEEVDKVIEARYQLSFRVPTQDELKKLRRIHRDITRDERARIKQAEEQITDLLTMIEQGDLPPDALPERLRKRMRNMLGLNGSE